MLQYSSLSYSYSNRKRNPNPSNEHNRSMLKNDVFLNFSYEDIGKSFISHLKTTLGRHGFTVFDHTMLAKGHNMCSELSKAIKESQIYVLVFSINYAFSERCLNELVKIMDCFCKLSGHRKVLPVFYKVEPSDVRKQLGPFKEAFQAHETNFDTKLVQNWRQALQEAGQLSGYHLKNDQNEEKFIRKIVEELENMHSPQELLHVTDHPVGIAFRVEELISKLRLDLKDVLFVAVLGISGIGKTTIVKATYNRLAAKFDASCFLADICYYCGSPNWKVSLQKELISCLSENVMPRIKYSHNDGVTKIRKLISHRKILLVLDDVDNFEQLQALGIHPECFYDGSRIIVTTRDKQSLGNLSYVSYRTMLLNPMESLELFNRLTFKKDDHVENKFVTEVVNHAGGLPLVLEVWSRHFKHHERKQWPRVLETLKRIPHDDVQKKLKISYDSLTNRAKKLFLDVACFFDRMEKDFIVKVLEDEDSAFFPDNEIQYLVDKSLLDIGFHSRVSMHDAIRKMGQEIVRLENEDEPGQRTRLINQRDVIRILTECLGTDSVESIRLDYHDKKQDIKVEAESLRKMRNLRLIHLSCYRVSWTCLNDDMSSFSFKKLQYLEWYGFPFKCINTDMRNVVVLRLQHSKLELLCEGIKSLKKLRILNVNDSSSLTKTGNFYGLENLEELNFAYCRNLEELHNSIGCLDKLAILDLRGCTRLKRFPWEMTGKLQSLRELKLSDCPNVGLEHDEVVDQFISSLIECRITTLLLARCNILNIPCEIGSLKSLQDLDISGNRFPSLPDTLGQLHRLGKIKLSQCANICSIPNLPVNIAEVGACDCTKLINLPSNISELKKLRRLWLNGCSKLSVRDLTFENCTVSHLPTESEKLDAVSGNTYSSLLYSFEDFSDHLTSG